MNLAGQRLGGTFRYKKVRRKKWDENTLKSDFPLSTCYFHISFYYFPSFVFLLAQFWYRLQVRYFSFLYLSLSFFFFFSSGEVHFSVHVVRFSFLLSLFLYLFGAKYHIREEREKAWVRVSLSSCSCEEGASQRTSLDVNIHIYMHAICCPRRDPTSTTNNCNENAEKWTKRGKEKRYTIYGGFKRGKYNLQNKIKC